MTIEAIEDKILFYISLKNPKRIEDSSTRVQYVFNGNEIKRSQKRLQIQKKSENYKITLHTELKNTKLVSSKSYLDITTKSSELNEALLNLFLSHESKEQVFLINNPSGLFPKLKNYLKLSFFNWI